MPRIRKRFEIENSSLADISTWLDSSHPSTVVFKFSSEAQMDNSVSGEFYVWAIHHHDRSREDPG